MILKQKIRELFKNSKIDCALIINGSIKDNSFIYFTQFFQEFEGLFLILKKPNKAIILCSNLEFDLIKQLVKGIKIIKYDSKKRLLSLLKKQLSNKIGLNYNKISVNLLKKLKKMLPKKQFVDISNELISLQSIKTKEEIKKIQKACEITTKTFNLIPKMIKIGITEKELSQKIEGKFKELNAQGIAFPLIVAFGNNTKLIHSIPSNKKLKKGNLILIDIGCKFQGYCSDVTRCFSFGKPGKEVQKVFNEIKKIQLNLINQLKPGINWNELNKRANTELKKSLNQSLKHFIGHGLGLQAHEPLIIKKRDYLKEGMILTIEPGYYGNSFGLRLEDTILITKTGFKVLSKAKKELMII